MLSFKLSTYDYEYPPELVAQRPLADRASARMLVLERATGKITHDRFFNLPKYLSPSDCLVMNDTKVIPARLYGTKESTGAKMEILLERQIGDNWEVMMKNSRRVKEGDTVTFSEGLTATVIKKMGKTVELLFNYRQKELMDRIWKAGVMPLPPYITQNPESSDHKENYQTIYAVSEGAKAAPTAGLHFNADLMQKLSDKKVKMAKVTLHVGLGTFEPLMNEDIRNHKMHSESYEISREAAVAINSAKKYGRVIAVGTTSLRAIESCQKEGKIVQGAADTSLYVMPGYEFQVTSGLITNFHLPKTTLMVLVSAFAGIENIQKAYAEAIQKRYRLFSYGDGMLII
jgi:S-adenosylmethionine:tRNA ribosyltransferase-isomerase